MVNDIAPGPTLAARLKMSGWLAAMESQLVALEPMPSAVAALHDRVADLAEEMFEALETSGDGVPEDLPDTFGELLARIETVHTALIEEPA